MNYQKIYKSKNPIGEFFLLGIANILIVWSILKIDTGIIAIIISIIFINLFGYYSIGVGMHNFILGANNIYIYNSWLPIKKIYIEYDNINIIKAKSLFIVGGVLFLHLKDGRVKGWANNLKSNELDELISLIKLRSGIE